MVARGGTAHELFLIFYGIPPMRRSLALLVVVLAACSSGGGNASPGGGTTNPPSTTVASVTIGATVTTLQVGGTTTLSATALNASGTTLSGKTTTWTSSAPTVATVSSAGVVTAVASGTTVITATIETKTATQTITVAAVASNCTSVSLNTSELRTLTGAERTAFCVTGGSTGAEYLLIPFNTESDTLKAPTLVPVTVTPANTVAILAQPLAVQAGATAALTAARGVTTHDPRFELALRRTERRTFGAAMARKGRAAAFRSLASSRTDAALQAPGGPSYIKNLGANPTVGTLVALNANGNDACTNAITTTGRVAAVSTNAIVIADTTSPANGFTDAEYQSFATTFDTLIFALDTTAFGAPFDMDGNKRVILYFTPEVNKLTPANSTGSIGGFFFARDLFPSAANANGLFPCTSSNEGEMFYLPVVDANAKYNGFFRSKTTLRSDVIGTLAHEFQHLINASRRIYVTDADDFEDVWLNEGMSHIAEELLYYRVTGLSPKSDLTLTSITATQARLDAVNAYQVGNLANFADYLKATDTGAPYKQDDDFATRGAAWNLLRYALDLGSGLTNTYLRALVNNVTNGIPNFNQTFANVFTGGVVGATRQMVIANFFDNANLPIDPKYAFPSWNYRSVLPALASSGSGFQLVTKGLVGTTPQSYTLRGGGAGYYRFRVSAGQTGTLTPTSGGAAVPAGIEMILIRTQ